MSSFTRLVVEHLQQPIDGKWWRVAEPFEYHIGTHPSEQVIVVPRDFLTDFMSIPPIYRWRFDPAGRGGPAGVVHDFLYLRGGYDTPDGFQPVTRAEADGIFRDALAVLGVNWWDRHVIWLAVRVGGGAVWKRYRDAGVVV